MLNLIEKIKIHGIKDSARMALNLLQYKIKEIPDRSYIAFLQLISSSGLSIKKIQGSYMVLDLNDVGISSELLLTGIHEAESTKQIRQEIKPGMHIVEVGANIGYYALIEAGLIGKEGKIYAFEPSPVNMKTLKANIALNSLNDVIQTFPYGVGNKNSVEKFHLMSKGNMSSFIPRKEGRVIRTLDSVDVEIIRLDDFFETSNTAIDYVRMDVEGFEVEVIQGMAGTLKGENSPRGLFIEIHSELLQKKGTSCRGLISLLHDVHYEVKVARYRGRDDVKVMSTEEFQKHAWREKGYWEVFFQKQVKKN